MKFSYPPRWSEITTLFGGRFDPPHLGHRQAVRSLFEFPGVKEVLIIPSAAPPHKSTWAPSHHRAEMARLGFLPTVSDPYYPKNIHFDLREINRHIEDPQQLSYSFHTLQELQPLHSSLAFVIGVDQLIDLPTWYRFPEILGLCHWFVLKRKPFHPEAIIPTLSHWSSSGLIRQVSSEGWQINRSPYSLTLIPTEAPQISSTKIRESIALTGQAATGTLLPEVESYLKKNKLYGI